MRDTGIGGPLVRLCLGVQIGDNLALEDTWKGPVYDVS